MSWWSHRKMRKLVTAYVDGEIDPAGAAQVAAHLQQCWSCNSDVEQLCLIKASLRNLRARRPAAVAVARLRRWASELRP
jgi:anti-sigma factor RsiW